MTIADTDVLIDFLAGASPAAERVAEHISGGGLFTTAVSRFELLCGVRNAKEEAAIRTLLSAVPALPLDDDAADKAAEVRRSLAQSGASIGMADSLIAAIAMAHGAALLTRNRRHFGRVRGLRLAELV